MLQQLTDWLTGLVKAVFGALWSFLQDIFIAIFDAVVSAFAALVSLIPVPGWLSGGLGSTWNGMDSTVLYIVSQCGVPAALAIIGGGYLFRFTRKVFTLFQW